jgi:hypothetical protein
MHSREQFLNQEKYQKCGFYCLEPGTLSPDSSKSLEYPCRSHIGRDLGDDKMATLLQDMVSNRFGKTATKKNPKMQKKQA